MHLMGLTGGIASGKTLVSDRFAHHGVPIIDADLLAREVVAPGSPGLAALAERFGKAVLTRAGELDRAWLRQRIFASDTDRQAVDSILHPLIRERAEAGIDAARQTGHHYAVYAVPLLVETGQTNRFDRIVIVDVPPSLQLERLLARDGSNEAQARSILAAQASREERLAIADDVIDNTGSIADTHRQVDTLHGRYLFLDTRSRRTGPRPAAPRQARPG